MNIAPAPNFAAQLVDDLMQIPARIEAAYALFSTGLPPHESDSTAELAQASNNLDLGPSLGTEMLKSSGCAALAFNTTRPLLAWLFGIPARAADNPVAEAGLRFLGGAAGQAVGEWNCNQRFDNGSYVGYGTTAIAAGISAGEVIIRREKPPTQTGGGSQEEAQALMNAMFGGDMSGLQALEMRGTPYRVYNPRVPVEPPPERFSALKDHIGTSFLGSAAVLIVGLKEREIRQNYGRDEAVDALSNAYSDPKGDLNAVFAKIQDGEMLNRVIEKLQGDFLGKEAGATAFRARLNAHQQARFDLSIKTIDTVGVNGHGRPK